MSLRRFLLLTVFVGVGLQPAPLFAQAPSDQTTQDDPAARARALFAEAGRAYQQGRVQDAYQAYLASWKLQKSYDVAGNLGNVELDLGKARDAAEHLAYSLKYFALTAPKDQRQFVEQRFAEARSKVASVEIGTNIEQAEIFVDGRAVGRAPLQDPVFVEPGNRAIEARLPGYTTARQVLITVEGSTDQVHLRLVPAPSTDFAAAKKRPGEPKPSERRSLVPIVTGAAATAVGTGLGIGFTLHSNALSRDADQMSRELQKVGGTSACLLSAVAPNCSEFRETFKDKGSFRNAAIISFVVGGLAGAAALTYTLWPNAQDKKPTVKAVASVGPGSIGVVVGGQF
jgi:hypothetical protein